MKHKEIKEWLHLLLANELSDEEEKRVREHLGQCDECRAEFHELEQLMTHLGESGAREPSEQLLWEARQALRDSIAEETETKSISARTAQGVAPMVSGPRGGVASSRSPAYAGWTGWFRGFRLALSGAAAVAVGLFIGYVAFGRGGVTPPAVPSDTPVAGAELGGPDIANVRFLDWSARDGEVEIRYDLVRPVRLRAAVDDDRVQRVLARALQTGDNAGVRLKAIRALDATPTRTYGADVKAALIASLKTDPNAGVRKESLRALQKLPFDGQIKDACLYVLQNDDNPGMRVASINLLSGASLEGHPVSKEVHEVIDATLKQEDDPFLRARSALFIEEVQDE
jgi:hypothetical protein